MNATPHMPGSGRPQHRTGPRPILGLLVLAAASLAACSHVPSTARYDGTVVSTDAANVATCRYLGALSSSSGLTGLFAPKGVDNIKQNLLKQAEKMGATHVVWDHATADYDTTSLSGKAYHCPP